MTLPVLNVHHGASAEDLMRFFARAELHWTRHIAEEVSLDWGTAFVNAQLPNLSDANRVLEVSLPAGLAPRQAAEQISTFFAERKTQCRAWVMAASGDPERRRAMAKHLLEAGYVESLEDVVYLVREPPRQIAETEGLTIIPARASYRHYRMLAEEWATEQRTAELAEATMLHLDDPHVDALLALKDGRATAIASVLAVGEIGCIRDVFVAKAFRSQGMGKTMVGRAMGICARSLFRHIFFAVRGENVQTIALYRRFGFERIGALASYHASPPP